MKITKYVYFESLLTIFLIYLKITSKITWSWFVVFLPIIIPFGLVVLSFLIIGIITYKGGDIDDKSSK